MEAIIVHGTNKRNTKFIIELAKRLGGSVKELSKEQYEDIMTGELMDKIKTGQEILKTTILEKLK